MTNKQLAAVALNLIASQFCAAADYVIDVPQLVGLQYPLAGSSVNVSLQLPTQFLRIDAASLHLKGTHFVGRFFPSIDGPNGPVGASLHLQDPPQGLPDYPYPYFYDQLPVGMSDIKAFDVNEPIRSPSGAPSDFRYWLDGSVEFSFFVATGTVFAKYGYAALPQIHVDQAQLSVSGEPLIVPEVPTATLFMLSLLSCIPRRHRPTSHNDV